MKIIVFPDHVYKDERANAPCPLIHAGETSWPNLMVYSKVLQAAPSRRTGPLSLKCVFQGREFYAVEDNRYAVDALSHLIINRHQSYVYEVDSKTAVEASISDPPPAGNGTNSPDHDRPADHASLLRSRV